MPTVERVAIVTGGGTGIGEAASLRLARAGTAVSLVGRRSDALETVADQIRASGGEALAISADLAALETPWRVVEATLTAWDRIDVVVNNAAFIRNQRLEDIEVDILEQHLAVNIRAPLLLIQAALPALRLSNAPAVVNISSSSASLSIPGQSCYGLTKAALEYLTRSLASELAADRIRVNCIAPGPVDTPIHATWARDPEEARRVLVGAVPLGRIAEAEEVAAWVEFLVRPDDVFTTGAVIPVDGGQTLAGAMSAIAAAADD